MQEKEEVLPIVEGKIEEDEALPIVEEEKALPIVKQEQTVPMEPAPEVHHRHL